MVSTWLCIKDWGGVYTTVSQRNVEANTLYRTRPGMSYPHPEPWKGVLFSRGFSPLGQQPGPLPPSSPDSRTPMWALADLDLAHVCPHATPPAPFHPQSLCVYQTDLTLRVSQEPRSQFLFHVYGQRSNKYKWMMSTAYRKTAEATSPGNPSIICSSQPWLPAYSLWDRFMSDYYLQ